MKKKLCLVIVCLFVEVGFFTTPCASKEASQKKNLISMDFQQVPLGSVLRVLSSKTGRKFITDANLAGKRILLQLKNVSPDEAVNALLDTYDLYYIRQADTNIYVIRSKTIGEIVTVSKIFYCSYAKAKELAAVLASKLTKGGDLQADVRTNSLIVTDMADSVDKIGALIAELDSPTPQVLLETKIIDIKIDDEFKFGINIGDFYDTRQFWENPLSKERAEKTTKLEVIEGTQDTQKVVMLQEDDYWPKYTYNQPLGQGLGAGARFKMAIIEQGYNIEALIEAVKTNADAHVLSNPKLLVLNNQEAQITIADEIPFQQMTQTGEGQPIAATSFKPVGVILKVKPLINKNRTIVLEISPEQSFLTGYSVDNIPIINTSKCKTTLMIRDGETAVIGGLIREEEAISEIKVPLLGDIPLLGYFFKKVTRKKSRKELTIFVTASIVGDIVSE